MLLGVGGQVPRGSELLLQRTPEGSQAQPFQRRGMYHKGCIDLGPA